MSIEFLKSFCEILWISIELPWISNSLNRDLRDRFLLWKPVPQCGSIAVSNTEDHRQHPLDVTLLAMDHLLPAMDHLLPAMDHLLPAMDQITINRKSTCPMASTLCWSNIAMDNLPFSAHSFPIKPSISVGYFPAGHGYWLPKGTKPTAVSQSQVTPGSLLIKVCCFARSSLISWNKDSPIDSANDWMCHSWPSLMKVGLPEMSNFFKAFGWAKCGNRLIQTIPTPVLKTGFFLLPLHPVVVQLVAVFCSLHLVSSRLRHPLGPRHLIQSLWIFIPKRSSNKMLLQCTS